MDHEQHLATLREGIRARTKRERAMTDREFVMLRVSAGEVEAEVDGEVTGPIRLAHASL